MIISTDDEKAFDAIQHPLTMKALKNMWDKRNILYFYFFIIYLHHYVPQGSLTTLSPLNQNLSLKGTLFNSIKTIYNKPTASIIINGEKLKVPLKDLKQDKAVHYLICCISI